MSQKWLMFIKHTAKNKQLELPSFHVLLGPCRSDLGLLEGYVSWGGKTVVEGLKLAPFGMVNFSEGYAVAPEKNHWKIRPLMFFSKKRFLGFRFLDSASVYHTICEICPIWVILYLWVLSNIFSSQQGFDLRLIRHHWRFFVCHAHLYSMQLYYTSSARTSRGRKFQRTRRRISRKH